MSQETTHTLRASRTSVDSGVSMGSTTDLSRNSSITDLPHLQPIEEKSLTSAHQEHTMTILAHGDRISSKEEKLATQTPNLKPYSYPDAKHLDLMPPKYQNLPLADPKALEEAPNYPAITVTTLDIKEQTLVPKITDNDSGSFLNIPRKLSAASSTASDEYLTPPTSPPSLTRSLSIESSSSCGSSEMMRVDCQVQVKSPNTEEKVRIKAKTSVPKRKGNLDLTISIHFRSKSSPASTPNSPSLADRKWSVTLHQGAPFRRTRTEKDGGKDSSHNSSILLPQEPHALLNHAEPQSSPHPQANHSEEHQDNTIAGIIQAHMREFTGKTDIDSLYPCLFQTGLIARKDWEELQSYSNNSSKMNYFYIYLLSTKGIGAYQKLFQCLQEEKDHSGHQHLVRIIEGQMARLHA